MVERCPCKADVSGSSPLISNKIFLKIKNKKLYIVRLVRLLLKSMLLKSLQDFNKPSSLLRILLFSFPMLLKSLQDFNKQGIRSTCCAYCEKKSAALNASHYQEDLLRFSFSSLLLKSLQAARAVCAAWLRIDFNKLVSLLRIE